MKLIVGGCPRSGTGALASLLTYDGRALVTQEEGLNAWKNKKIYGKYVIDMSTVIYVGDKMPEEYLLNAHNLCKKYPDAKFIFTIRSGHGVIASYIRRQLRPKNKKGKWGKSPKDITHDKLLKQIKAAENVWVRNANQILTLPNRMSKNSYLLLKYEDNHKDIDGMLKKLGKFLGYDSPVINTVIWHGGENKYVSQYRQVHLDWKKNLEFWVDFVLNGRSKEFENVMTKLGYEIGKPKE